MVKIRLDFSKVPSDVALFLAQDHTALDEFADSMTTALDLSWEDANLFGQELVGTIAGLIDGYLPKPIRVGACAGLLSESEPGRGECDSADDCTAIALLPDYASYRAAHARITAAWIVEDGEE